MDRRASPSPPPPAPGPHVGQLLREWRAARRSSQLALALEAGVSARHLSYVETGKAQPSRELVTRLADALEMPLRERNVLLMSAGYAPRHPETALGTPELAPVRHAIELILEHQEPYPAFLLNRRWDVLEANPAAARMNAFLLGDRPSPHRNMLRRFFDPNDLRAAVVNWEEVAGDLIRLTVVFRRGDEEFRFFSTITTFATPRDVTLDELQIECVFPADETTAEVCRTLVSG